MQRKRRLMKVCENLRFWLTTRVFLPAVAMRLFIAVFAAYQKAVNNYEIPMDAVNEVIFTAMNSAVLVPAFINAALTAEIASLRADIINYYEATKRR